MNDEQVVRALTTIPNILFGRNKHGAWKEYTRDSIIDKNTLPSMKNLPRTERYMEALTLNQIVEELMADDSSATVV